MNYGLGYRDSKCEIEFEYYPVLLTFAPQQGLTGSPPQYYENLTPDFATVTQRY